MSYRLEIAKGAFRDHGDIVAVQGPKSWEETHTKR